MLELFLDDITSLSNLRFFRPCISNLSERFQINIEMLNRYIDIGANLLDPMFRGIYRGSAKHSSDLDAVLKRAEMSGLRCIIITGTDLVGSRRALHLCRSVNASNRFTNLRLYSTVGVHPLSTMQLEFDSKQEQDYFPDAEESEDREFIEPRPRNKEEYINALRDVIRDGRSDGTVVAVGECGLDFEESRLKFASRETQEKHLPFQLDLSREFNLPLFLHNRDTAGRLLMILNQDRCRNGEEKGKGVIHSFDGKIEELKATIDAGYYIGLNGCSLRSEENLEMTKQIPLDKLLLESDAPWCSIKPSSPAFRYVTTHFETVKKPEKFEIGKGVKDRCEPCDIIRVAEVLASVQGIPLSVIAEAAYVNSVRLFNLNEGSK